MRNGLIDLLIATTIAVGVLLLLAIFPFVGLPPQVWEESAIAAGLLPQATMLPGLGIALGNIPYLSRLLLSASVFLAYGIFLRMIELTGIFVGRDLRRRKSAARLAAALGALALGCSEPFWGVQAGVQSGLVDGFLMLVAASFYTRFLLSARLMPVIGTIVALGILAAESPIGYVLLVLFVLLTPRYLNLAKDERWDEFLDPIRLQRTKWSLTFLFFSALFGTILVESLTYVYYQGLKAAQMTVIDLPLIYVNAYYELFASGLTPSGCLALIFAAVLPFTLVFIVARKATDEESFLSLKLSLVYFVCGVIALLQLSPFSFAWFWANSEGTSMSLAYILFGVILSAATLVWSLFVGFVELLCRDYAHIEELQVSDGEYALDSFESVRLSFPRRIMTLSVVLGLVAFCLWGRQLADNRQLQEVLHDYVHEVLEEADGLDYLVTDGVFDAYLRFEAKKLHQQLKFLSVVGVDSPREKFIRQMGTDGDEDCAGLKVGTIEALRNWVLGKSPHLGKTGVQLAYEIFNLNRRLELMTYGLIVRPVGGDAERASASIKSCHNLADRIIDLQHRGVWRHATDMRIKDRFLFAQFRLASLCRLRAKQLDPQLKTGDSIKELNYAERLDECNPEVMRVRAQIDWVRRQTGNELTPREGLELAMKRADFMMARRYAMPILQQNAEDPTANFALALSYYVEEQYAKAEEYLKRALKARPDVAAIHNNLALVYLKTNRRDKARSEIEEALRLMPDEPEIHDTKRQIEAAGE